MMSSALHRGQEQRFDEDLILVKRYLAGDESGFTEIYRKYYDKVYHIALGVLLRHDDAADAVQEIFTLVVRHLHKFDQRARFSTWLFRIAVNRSIQQSRGLRYRKREAGLTEAETVPAADHVIADPRVHRAMARLNPDDRAMLTLFYWEELSLNDIAASLGCSDNAAKTRLFRARERFKKTYEDIDNATT